MKPIHSFLILFFVGLAVSVTMLVFPEDGFKISEEFKLEFPSWNDIEFNSSSNDSIKVITDLEEYISDLTLDLDSVKLVDSVVIEDIEKKQEFLKLKVNSNPNNPLEAFFRSLDNIKDHKKIRILHFGDSQIESDRISGYIRDRFQKKFGGEGCGFLPIYTPIPIFSMNYKASGDWHRYTVYGNQDPSLNHNRFGITGSFERFSPIIADSLIQDTIVYTASVLFSKNMKSYHKNSNYKLAKLHYGNNLRPFVIRAKVNDQIFRIDTVKSKPGLRSLVYEFTDTPKELLFEFEGADSPEFYGVTFESNEGIYLDNLGMRGCSGTIFRKLDRTTFTGITDSLNVALVILQYGGNAIPYLRDSTDVAEYGSWYKSHINYLKKLNPQASFVLIGPSDMGEKDGTEMVTREYLLELNEELEEVAFETGSAYWDLFEIMGGENSMKTWVEADPPLAAKDYTHFSSKGARKVGELFYKSILDEYTKWKNEKENL